MGTSRGHFWALFRTFGGTCLSMGLYRNRGLICSHFSRYIWDAFPTRNQTPFQEHRGASGFGHFPQTLLKTFGHFWRRLVTHVPLWVSHSFGANLRTILKENRRVAEFGHFPRTCLGTLGRWFVTVCLWGSPPIGA